MLIAEAQWIGAALDSLPDEAFPLAHVGCQTEEFRTRTQPWVQEYVFTPLLRRGRAVVHVDIRDEPGVDLVADVTTERGQQLIHSRGARTVLCANLLEHVPDPKRVLDGLTAGVPEGGYLVLTGPLAFPYHPDPIDTMFRPTWQQMAELVGPEFSVLQGGEIRCRRLGYYYGLQRCGKLRLVARILLPFVKPAGWRERVRWSARHTSCYALVLRRRE